MKTNQKEFQMVTIVALFIAVVFISVGFALMSTALNVQGTVKVVPANWDVKFVPSTYAFSNNSTAAEDTVNPTSTPTAATFNDTTFSGYEITLTKPGDKGTITFDVENDGDLDAQVSSVTTGTPVYTGEATDPTQKAADEALVEANVTYTITWSDGTAMANGNTLAKKTGSTATTRTIKIEAEYDPDATAMPSAPVVISGKNLAITFTQAN